MRLHFFKNTGKYLLMNLVLLLTYMHTVIQQMFPAKYSIAAASCQPFVIPHFPFVRRG